jgi:gliding motility-associated-like protein
MKKSISYFIKGIPVPLLLLFLNINSYASHIVGMDLYYTHAVGNTYTITLVAFGDCGPASAPAFSTLPSATPDICIFDGNTYVTTVTLAILPPTTGVEITPVCTGTITQCSNPGSAVPGIKKFVYTGTYTVPHTSHYWRFLFTGDMGAGASAAGRAAAITNILGGTTTQLVDTLDDTHHNNSNPLLTIVPVPFFCLNNSDSYNPGAIDPDGDSLRFFLVAGVGGAGAAGIPNCTTPGVPVTYTGGHTATNPLTVAPGTFSLDPRTGTISFFPNAIQRALVVYNIEEYRNDTFIGTCQREMTFLVQVCTDPPPIGGFIGASSGTVVDSTHFDICSGTGAFSIIIHPTESDTNNLITVHPSGLPPGATFTTVGDSTNHPTCTFSWTTTGVPPGSYIFFVTYKDNNCPLPGVQTIAYTINILPQPIITASGGGTFCQGTPATLLATGGVSYTWSPGIGLSCTTCSSPVASPPLGTTVYTVTGTAANTCTNTATVSVTIVPLPVINASPGLTICKGTSTTLTVTGGISYTWSPGAGLSCTTCPNPVASPTGTTVYTVTGRNIFGCTNTDTVTVTIEAPTIVAGPPVILCANDSTTLSPTGGVSYTWSPGAGLSCTACPHPEANPAITTVYTVTGADSNGCHNTDTIRVTRIPRIIVSAANVAICLGNNATVTATGATSYTWSPAVGLSCTNCTSPIADPPATTTYTIVGTTSICHDTSTVTVTVNPLPVITAGGGTTKCAGDPAPLSAFGGVTYTWVPATGLSCTTCFAPIATPPTTTTYTVTAFNTFGCAKSTTVTVVINPLPVLVISPLPAKICYGSDVTLTVTGASTYTWYPTTGLSADTGSTVVAAPLSSVIYSVTGTDANNCKSTGSDLVTVVPVPPAPTVVSPISYCKNTIAVSLTATGSNLLWYTTSVGGVGDSTAPLPATTTTGSTTWYVSQTVNGCEGPRAPIEVDIYDNAITGFNMEVKYGCYVDTLLCSNTSQFINRSEWYFGDGTPLDTNTNPVHYYYVVKENTDYIITLRGYNPSCFSDSTTDTLVLKPTPTVNFLYNITPDAVITYGSSIQLNSDGAYIYLWAPDDGTLSNPNINNPVATPLHDTTYTIYGYNKVGCMDSAKVHVSLVYDEESVPNAFTPNGDGLNDLFRVHNLKYGEIMDFSVYNRWGQLIYKARDNKGWDGRFNNVPQDMGVYNYMIIVSHADGTTKLWKGDVTLIR